MEHLTPQQWAEGLRNDLALAGERVPFERALKPHLAGLTVLRARGLTWPSLANLLRKNAVRRPDGRFYSADHLRVSYGRLTKEPEDRSEPAQAWRREVWPAAEQSIVPGRQPTHHRHGRAPVHVLPATSTRTPPPVRVSADTNKDVSADELARIAARLSKLR